MATPIGTPSLNLKLDMDFLAFHNLRVSHDILMILMIFIFFHMVFL